MWLGGEVARIVGKYLRGMMVVVLLATIVYTVAFTAMGIENAFFLGIVAGMGEAIPFIGSVISFLVVAMFSLAGSSGQVLHIALVYLLYSLFQAQVIAPKVMGDNLRIHPVVVLIAILVMEPLLGLPGLVVAAPTAALVRSIYLHWQKKRPTIWG